MLIKSLLIIVCTIFTAGSTLATGHGALVLTDPMSRLGYQQLLSEGHLADDPLIQGKVIAALARLNAQSIEELESREVISSQGEEIGGIDSISVSQETGGLFAIIALDGISVANMKEIAVPLRQVVPDGRFRVIVPYSKAELQEMQDVDPWDNDLDDLS